jgi:hypothetical protein
MGFVSIVIHGRIAVLFDFKLFETSGPSKGDIRTEV